MMASASTASISRRGSVRHSAAPRLARIGSSAAEFASATPTTFTSDRSVRRLRCSLPKAPRPVSSRRRGRDDVADVALREFVNLDAAILRYEAVSYHPRAISDGKKDRPRAVEIAREGMMNGKAI